MKKLKKLNGRGHGTYTKGHLYVAAYSQVQAAELINKATGSYIGVSEIGMYYHKGTWGSTGNGRCYRKRMEAPVV